MATPFPRAIKEFESANVTVAKVGEKLGHPAVAGAHI
jgi:hypothetical protein